MYFMDEKNIKKYLKELMELESEKYKLEKIKHDIIRFEVNDLKEINKNEFVGYKNF